MIFCCCCYFANMMCVVCKKTTVGARFYCPKKKVTASFFGARAEKFSAEIFFLRFASHVHRMCIV